MTMRMARLSCDGESSVSRYAEVGCQLLPGKSLNEIKRNEQDNFLSLECHFHLFLPFLSHFDAILTPLSVMSGSWRWSVNILIFLSVPHRFFFIATCISTIFRQKTSFPPTCAIFAPLPVTLIVDWRWSVDYPTDLSLLHHVPHRFFFHFYVFFDIFSSNNAISAYLRHFCATCDGVR